MSSEKDQIESSVASDGYADLRIPPEDIDGIVVIVSGGRTTNGTATGKTSAVRRLRRLLMEDGCNVEVRCHNYHQEQVLKRLPEPDYDDRRVTIVEDMEGVLMPLVPGILTRRT